MLMPAFLAWLHRLQEERKVPGARKYCTILCAPELDRPWNRHELEQLAPLPVTLGRAAGNTILLNSRGVSRQHAQIEQATDGSIVITDRNSSNGTFLDGQRITRAALREGSSFQIGPFVICVAFWPPTQQKQAATQLGLAPNLLAAPPLPAPVVGATQGAEAPPTVN